ncbi:hypothetical protein MRX96_043951 [Rhipicephalus microplus]
MAPATRGVKVLACKLAAIRGGAYGYIQKGWDKVYTGLNLKDTLLYTWRGAVRVARPRRQASREPVGAPIAQPREPPEVEPRRRVWSSGGAKASETPRGVPLTETVDRRGDPATSWTKEERSCYLFARHTYALSIPLPF